MIDFLSNTLGQVLKPLIANFVGWIQGFWEILNTSRTSTWKILLDILLVSTFFYAVLKWIRGTRAIRIMAGLSILGIILLFSKILELKGMLTLLDSFLAMMIVAIPIVFQPELRRGLEQLGHTRFFSEDRPGGFSAVHAIVRAAEILANKRLGALIVIQQHNPLREYIDTGILLNADISRELLLNIFSGKAPLHDGAVIVQGGKLIAAGCVLPISEKRIEGHLGTRHRSAIGLSEMTDAVVVVVSEERGTISIAFDGKLRGNITTEDLEKILRQLMISEKNKKKK
ncbi:TIGR00159 family protein [Candidatus Peregrinibacteria bacterium]|nr:TIGR00159 family protein [Candidatus Peregrinibacteria bacterium]